MISIRPLRRRRESKLRASKSSSIMASLLILLYSALPVLGQPQNWPTLSSTANASPTPPILWQPPLGSKFQIILDQRHGSRSYGRRKQTSYLPADADVFDVDLFDTSASMIEQLHSEGKKVICYFSAGGTETWRPDYSSFNETDKGDTLREWVGEQWLDTRSPRVLEVMKKRIQMASTKGCDAIDPDNIGKWLPIMKKIEALRRSLCSGSIYHLLLVALY
jgi:hypothetical protein